jgi:hypothetical protein
MSLHHRVNRRQLRTQRVLAHIMHIIAPHLKESTGSDPIHHQRDVARQLEEFLFTQGADFITEADRLDAGLQPRDHNGLTLEELVIIEARMLIKQMELPTAAIIPLAPRSEDQS